MHITSYDSLEAMVADMQENERRANDTVLPWQTRLKEGDKFVVFEPDWDLWAFCEVRADSGRVTDHSRGYRFCDNYSVMCPEGDMADCHVLKALVVLDDEKWQAAKAHGWNLDSMLGSEDDAAVDTARHLVAVLVALNGAHPYLRGRAI